MDYTRFKSGMITIEEAMKLSDIDSKSTYYRRVKELLNLTKKTLDSFLL